MKRPFVSCAVILGLLFGSVGGVLAEGYVGIYGGVGIPETFDDVKGRDFLAGTTLSDLKLETGAIVGAKLGAFGPASDPVGRWLGIELDVSYLMSELKQQTARLSVGAASVPVSLPATDLNFIVGAAHVLVRYPGDMVQPYIGAGPAVVHGRLSSLATTIPFVGAIRTDTQTATNIGLSGVGGLRLRFSQHVGAFLEYKYIRADLEFDQVEGSFVAHAGVGGVSLHF